MELHVELNGIYRQSLKTLAVIDASSPLPSNAALDWIGDLAYTARTPLPAYRDNTVYDVSLLNFTEIMGTRPNAMTWSQLMRRYTARDGTCFYSHGALINNLMMYPWIIVKTVVTNIQASWSSGRGIGQPLVVTGRIYIPSDRIYYIPGPWEVLKFGWIQYLSYFILVGVVLVLSFHYLLKSNLLVSSVVEPSYNQVPYSSVDSKSASYGALKTFVY